MKLHLIKESKLRLNILWIGENDSQNMGAIVKSVYNSFVVGTQSLIWITQRVSGECSSPDIQHMIVLSTKPATTRSVQRMTEGKPYLPWPGADDRIIVEEMLRDRSSGQWYECREFVKRLVQGQAKNIPKDHWEDLVQDAMMRVDKYLRTFRYQCKLSTWLFGIVRSCIIDAHRKFTRAGQFIAPPGDPLDDVEREYDEID